MYLRDIDLGIASDSGAKTAILRMPEIDFDALDYQGTATLPIATERGERHAGARHRRQPRSPLTT